MADFLKDTHIGVLQCGILSCFLPDLKLQNEDPTKYSSVIAPKLFGEYEKYAKVILKGELKSLQDVMRLFEDDPFIYSEIVNAHSTAFQLDLPNKIKLLAQLYLRDQFVGTNKEMTLADAKKLTKLLETIEDICNPNNGELEAILNSTETLIDNFKEKGIGYQTGMDKLDEVIGGLRYGTVTRLTGYSNKGKSRFMYQTINSVIKQQGKCIVFNLEVPSEYNLMYLTSNWFKIPSNEFEQGRHKDKIAEYVALNSKYLNIVDNIHDINAITAKIKTSDAEVVFIDFVQNIKANGTSEYESMTEVARELQGVANETNKAIFDLSQVSNDGAKNYKLGDMIPSKGSGALVHSADIGIIIYGVDETCIAVAKNKFGKKDIKIDLDCDFSTSTFKYKKGF